MDLFDLLVLIGKNVMKIADSTIKIINGVRVDLNMYVPY